MADDGILFLLSVVLDYACCYTEGSEDMVVLSVFISPDREY
jgi:hypothetical protein